MFKIIWKCPLKIIIATCDQFQSSTLHVKVATRYHLGSLFPPDDSQPGQRPPQPGPISTQRSTIRTHAPKITHKGKGGFKYKYFIFQPWVDSIKIAKQ